MWKGKYQSMNNTKYVFYIYIYLRTPVQSWEDTSFMSADSCGAQINQREHVENGSFQPTLWLSSVVEIDLPFSVFSLICR